MRVWTASVGNTRLFIVLFYHFYNLRVLVFNNNVPIVNLTYDSRPFITLDSSSRRLSTFEVSTTLSKCLFSITFKPEKEIGKCVGSLWCCQFDKLFLDDIIWYILIAFQLIFCLDYFILHDIIVSFTPDAVQKRLAWLCLLCCYQPSCVVSQHSWFWAFFVSFSNFTPPPRMRLHKSTEGHVLLSTHSKQSGIQLVVVDPRKGLIVSTNSVKLPSSSSGGVVHWERGVLQFALYDPIGVISPEINGSEKGDIDFMDHQEGQLYVSTGPHLSNAALDIPTPSLAMLISASKHMVCVALSLLILVIIVTRLDTFSINKWEYNSRLLYFRSHDLVCPGGLSWRIVSSSPSFRFHFGPRCGLGSSSWLNEVNGIPISHFPVVFFLCFYFFQRWHSTVPSYFRNTLAVKRKKILT